MANITKATSQMREMARLMYEKNKAVVNAYSQAFGSDAKLSVTEAYKMKNSEDFSQVMTELTGKEYHGEIFVSKGNNEEFLTEVIYMPLNELQFNLHLAKLYKETETTDKETGDVEITRHIEGYDKLKAIEILNKMNGFYELEEKESKEDSIDVLLKEVSMKNIDNF